MSITKKRFAGLRKVACDLPHTTRQCRVPYYDYQVSSARRWRSVMLTAILVLAGYVGFSWTVAAFWIGWSLFEKCSGKPIEARI
jgi:hypothetical protein